MENISKLCKKARNISANLWNESFPVSGPKNQNIGTYNRSALFDSRGNTTKLIFVQTYRNT